MSEKAETDLRAFVKHCEQVTVPGVVLGSDHLAIVLHALALHEKLTASEAECERLRREVEERDAKLAASAQLNCDLVSQNAKLIERNKSLGCTPDLWALERQELSDVRKLDLNSDASGFGHVTSPVDGDPSGSHMCIFSALDGPLMRRAVYGDGYAAARRAAVEYLEKKRT